MTNWNRLFPGKNINEWAWFFAPSALLLIPFINFAKSNTYPVLAPETLVLLLGLLIIGVVLGISARLAKSLRAFFFAATLTLMIDVQTTWFFDYSLYQYLWLPVGLYVLTLFSPEYIKTFVLVMVYATLFAILVTPESRPIQTKLFDEKPSEHNMSTSRKNPSTVWIHIIVDEQIGIESIPIQFDPDNRLAERLKNDYISNGFTVYGRAFTRFSQTHSSVPNILNLSRQHPRNFISIGTSTATSFSLTQSKYLDRLRQQGFKTHVYSMDYLKICDLNGTGIADVCSQYDANTIWGLIETSLSMPEKTLLILRIYARLSKVYNKLVTALKIDKRLSIPASTTPLIGLKVLARFQEDLLSAEPGTVWLIHLPLPHYPYALKRDCSIRSFPWHVVGGDSDSYKKNSAQERRAKYPLYLEQVECVNRLLQSLFAALKKSGVYDNSHIVVHGDHGSRIATHNLRQRASYRSNFRPSAETMVDYFGTLFAYKPAGTPRGNYRREIVSVSDLLAKASAGKLNDNSNFASSPVAYLVEWADNACQDSKSEETKGCRVLPLTMPAFSYGRVRVEND